MLLVVVSHISVWRFDSGICKIPWHPPILGGAKEIDNLPDTFSGMDM